MKSKEHNTFDVFAFPNEAGTATLQAFLANEPNAVDLQIVTHRYSEAGRTDAIARILDCSNLPRFSLHNALTAAASHGHADVVKQLLTHREPPPLNDVDTASPLWSAALAGHAECARVLLEAGADPNQMPVDWPAFTKNIPAQADGPTPLLNAIRGGNVAIVRELIRRGVDVNKATRADRRPLDVALALGMTEVVAVLEAAGAKRLDESELSLEQAVRRGVVDRVAQLVELEGTEEEVRDRLARLATQHGQVAVVALLVERGLSHAGRANLLEQAAYGNQWDLVNPLIALGALPNQPDKKPGQTPLLLASFANRWDIVARLLEIGADPRLDRNDGGETSLLTASREGRADMVELLLNAGADPNARTEYGDTPLTEARNQRNQKVISLLEAKGAKARTLAQRKSDLRKQLAPLKRPCWIPQPSRSSCSRVGGVPSLSSTEPWPVCAECNEPMAFALQLALSELPRAHPSYASRGLLQLFFCVECDHGKAFSPTHLARVFHVENEPLADAPEQCQTWPPVPMGTWKKAHDLPYREPGLAEFERLTAGFGTEEGHLLFSLNLQHDKAGGWPNWVQDNAYPACPECKSHMRTLVLQLGSNDHLRHRFGDNGLAFLFQCEAHPQRVAFLYQSA